MIIFKGKNINFAPLFIIVNVLLKVMDFIERLQNEKTNLSGDIFMYEDGSEFVKAFERSAFMLCKVFKPMKPLIARNKEYGGQYVKIGYSKQSLTKYTSHPDYDYTKMEDNGLVVHRLTRKTQTDFPEEEYSVWKQEAIAQHEKKNEEKRQVANTSSIHGSSSFIFDMAAEDGETIETKMRKLIKDIMQQSLADYTPMRALNYLNSIQERIRNEGLSD